jgi:hypothetical protein
MYCWEEATSSSNMQFLLKSNLDVSPLDVEQLDSSEGVEAFIRILNERFNKFGVGKKLKSETDLKIKIIKLRCKYISSGDRFLLNTIKIFESQLKELDDIGVDNEYDFEKDLGELCERYNTVIDPKNITLYQFDMLKKRLLNG